MRSRRSGWSALQAGKEEPDGSQYGSRFSDAQKADLRRLCALAQPPLDRLRAYALENGDSSALYLKPLVEREKNPLDNTRVGKTPDTAKKP